MHLRTLYNILVYKSYEWNRKSNLALGGRRKGFGNNEIYSPKLYYRVKSEREESYILPKQQHTMLGVGVLYRYMIRCSWGFNLFSKRREFLQFHMKLKKNVIVRILGLYCLKKIVIQKPCNMTPRFLFLYSSSTFTASGTRRIWMVFKLLGWSLFFEAILCVFVVREKTTRIVGLL